MTASSHGLNIGLTQCWCMSAQHRHKKTLQDEAEKLSRLNHANIVQLLGVVLEPRNYSVVLEYVEHGGLDDFINTYEVRENSRVTAHRLGGFCNQS